ncbi:MAG: hypothetical protein M3Y36_11345 [Actinomycetota bacterium]|nr:hypothetical protein [Actinomycetota bacterium]
MNRRMFLRNGSLAVVGAGVLTSVPGLSSVLASAEAEAPEIDTSVAGASEGAALPADVALDTPLVAHVKDLATGEISVYYGQNEVTFQDRQLASRLFRTAK